MKLCFLRLLIQFSPGEEGRLDLSLQWSGLSEVCSVQCAVFILQFAVCCFPCEVCNMQCEVCSEQFKVCSVGNAMQCGCISWNYSITNKNHDLLGAGNRMMSWWGMSSGHLKKDRSSLWLNVFTQCILIIVYLLIFSSEFQWKIRRKKWFG